MKEDGAIETDDKKDKPMDNLPGNELSWTSPRRGMEGALQRNIRLLKVVGLRALVVPGLLLLGLYIMSRYLVGPLEVEWGLLKVFLGLLGIIGYSFINAVFQEWCPDRYKMNDEGIEIRSSTSSEGNGLIPWHKIRSFYLERKPDGENADLLVLYPDRGRKVLWLPEDEMKDTIITIVKDKIPCQEISSRKTYEPIISNWAADFLWLLTGIYAMGIGYFLGTAPIEILPHFGWIALGTLVFGPGTLGCLLLYHKGLMRPHILMTAGMYNFISLGVLFLIAVMFQIHQTLQIAKGSL